MTDQSMDSAPTDRAAAVLAKLQEMAADYKRAKLGGAYLLEECRQGKYWIGVASAWKEYVEEIVGIPMRTAQALTKVVRVCNECGITKEQVAEVGWSKLAAGASQLTKENAAATLDQFKKTSLSQIAERRKQSSKSSRAKNIKSEGIEMTASIQQALRLASMHTRDTSVQRNLEFISLNFLESQSPPSRFVAPSAN